MNSLNFEQGTIITANILFSNQVGIKPRPALVISNSEYNSRYHDIIILKITSSREKPFPYNVDISNSDLIEGKLKNESTIMADFPITLEKEQVIQMIAKLSNQKLSEVKKKMKELYLL